MLIAGILIGILSIMLSSFGQIVQKKGHVIAAKAGKHYICTGTWMVGQFLALCGVPIFIIAISMTSQTSLSILPALSIILVTIWSCIFLDSEFTKWEFMSLAFLIPGTTVVLIFSNVPKQEIGAYDLKDFVYSPQSIAFITIAILLNISWGILVYYILKRYRDIQQTIRYLNDELRSDTTTTRSEGTTNVIPKIDIRSYKWSVAPMIFYPYFSSFYGTLSNTMVRALLIVYEDDMKHHEEGGNSFGVISIVMLVLVNLMLMGMSLFYLNKCLQYFEPIYIIPMIKVSTLFNNILWGGIIYQEFDFYNPQKTMGIIVGTILCFVGASFYIFKKDEVVNTKGSDEEGAISWASYGTTAASTQTMKLDIESEEDQYSLKQY